MEAKNRTSLKIRRSLLFFFLILRADWIILWSINATDSGRLHECLGSFIVNLKTKGCAQPMAGPTLLCEKSQIFSCVCEKSSLVLQYLLQCQYS